jgi:hypothetical protein
MSCSTTFCVAASRTPDPPTEPDSRSAHQQHATDDPARRHAIEWPPLADGHHWSDDPDHRQHEQQRSAGPRSTQRLKINPKQLFHRRAPREAAGCGCRRLRRGGAGDSLLFGGHQGDLDTTVDRPIGRAVIVRHWLTVGTALPNAPARPPGRNLKPSDHAPRAPASSDRCQFDGKRVLRMAVLSVCPVTRTDPCDSGQRLGDTFHQRLAVTGTKLALPGANRPSPRIVITLRSTSSRTATRSGLDLRLQELREPRHRAAGWATGATGGARRRRWICSYTGIGAPAERDQA